MEKISNYILRLISICVLLITACKNPPSEPESRGIQFDITTPEVTDDGWETDSLGSVGMNKQPIQNLINGIRNERYTEVHSVVIVKDGKLVFEKYWPGHDFGNAPPNYHGTLVNFDRNRRHNTHSATKSFTSSLVGIAIDKGFIQNVSDKIFNYLDAEYLTLDNDGREKITIEHMLKMASGLQWNEQEVSVSSSQMDMLQFNQSRDPVNYLLSKQVVSEPGTRFYYNGGGVDLLGVLVSNASNQSLPTFSNTYLFGPLGITNYNWVTLSPSGITAAHGDIHITPRDMAKFGYLFLNNGVWKGNRIISEQWVRASAQNHITPRLDLGAYGYGYLWWLKTYQSGGHNYDAYRADGWGGQQIVIFPSLNMVVIFTGANYSTNPPCDELMENHILQAL